MGGTQKLIGNCQSAIIPTNAMGAHRGREAGKSEVGDGGTSLNLHFKKMVLAILENWASQTLMSHRSHLGIANSADSDSVCLERGLRVCISNKLPGEVDVDGP